MDWVPPEVDTRRANVARVYDHGLGGTHNFLPDQDAARAIAAVEPNIRAMARANRAFLGRAVRFLAAAGIRQFLDIGSGIPNPLPLGDPAVLRRLRPPRPRAGLQAAVAARLARRRARRSEPAVGPGRRGPEGVTGDRSVRSPLA